MSVIPQKEILKYINEARTNPQQFSTYIKKDLDSFINSTTLPLKPGCNYSTNEGKGAWIQAYDFVKNHKPLPPYELNQGLRLAAEDHASDMVNNNFFGHSSSNGTSMSGRIQKRCGKSYGGCAECLGSDFKVEGRNHALQTVKQLIIDDGVPSRGHRKSIFSPDYKYVGSCSKVQGDKVISCIDLHTNNLSASNSQSSSSAVGNIQYDKPKNTGGSYQVSDQGWGDKGGFQVSKGTSGGSGDRYVASKSTSTKTSTSNGVTKKITTTKIKWSDGTTEEEVDEQVTKN